MIVCQSCLSILSEPEVRLEREEGSEERTRGETREREAAGRGFGGSPFVLHQVQEATGAIEGRQREGRREDGEGGKEGGRGGGKGSAEAGSSWGSGRI